MSKTKPSLPRGTRDFGPQVSAKRSYIIEKIKQNFIKYGFAQIETPAVENLSVLTGKYGDEGDQLLYKILNSGDYLSKANQDDYDKGSQHFTTKISEKGLRYDLTVPFARFVVMNQNDISFPFKRFQIQPVWRADRPQKGRYREFYQCDADIIGSKGIWSEIELTLLFKDVFKDLGLKDYVIKVNHRELLFALAEHVDLRKKTTQFCAEIDKLDKIGKDKVIANILALGASEPALSEVMELLDTKEQQSLLNGLQKMVRNNKAIQEIRDYFESLEALGRSALVELDLSLARGLSYYTGMIYEVKPTSVQMGSICGGGRYDDLTGIFGLKNVSGIGISFGLDRIYDVLEELSLFPLTITKQLDVLLVHFNEELLRHGHQLTVQLREAGIKADLYPETTKIRKQLDYAAKNRIPYVLFIGEEEMESKSYTLKNMDTGEQSTLAIDKIIQLFVG